MTTTPAKLVRLFVGGEAGLTRTDARLGGSDDVAGRVGRSSVEVGIGLGL